MGLFDELAGAAGSLLGGQGGANNLGGTAGALLQAINEHPGGLQGLASSFEQGGLQGAFQSWVGTGANQAVSGDQIQGALANSGLLDSFAAKAGISPDVAHTVAAQLLPMVINHVTPNGQMPAQGTDLMSMGASLLQAFTQGQK